MLARHILTYSFARGIPGIISLLSIYIYSRLLSPDEYGTYSMVIAGAGFASAIFFHWINVGMLRFLPAYQEQRNEFLSTIMRSFILGIMITLIPVTLLIIFQSDFNIKILLLLGMAITWAQSFHTLNLEFVRCQFLPKVYGILLSAKALLSLIIGSLLAVSGFGAYGVLFGTVAGFFLPSLYQFKQRWSGTDIRKSDHLILSQFLRYGLPLTATFALGMIINTSDRFLLGYYLGAKETGLYSAGYDLAKNSMGMIMVVINLAAYPLVVSALENKSAEETRAQLSKNLIALLIFAMPAATGLIILSKNITNIFLGQLFSGAASNLMPLIVIGALLSGIKSYYFDLSFQIGKCTIVQVWIVMIAAAINLTINFLIIPVWGIRGAAFANIIAYAVGLILSWRVGQKIYPLPCPTLEILKIFLATAVMILALLPLDNLMGGWFLLLQVAWGATIYGVTVYLLNVGGFKQFLVRKISSSAS